MKEVTLRILGEQKHTDGEKNDIELTTLGKFYKKNDIYYIVYDESELSGMEGSTTTLKIEGSKISMKRFGNNNSKLTFEQGKKHRTSYQTPYGNMLMEVVTRTVDLDISDKGKGNINLDYRLSIGGEVESRNRLSIKIH
ncbi:DUF1934 domain-containing protein [Dethiothermospora halolimnae]|uniref:DUF1934 domain-containing protein n=1 Tax=Dethiothermospora halolimnae TaxID=3114390 RepID=UPI003CCB9211